MPGVVVDEQILQSMDIHALSLTDLPSSPASCSDGSPRHLFQSPFSYLASSSISNYAPHLERSFSANSFRDREIASHMPSQLSPRPFRRSPVFASNEARTESFNVLGSLRLLDAGNFSVEGPVSAYDVQEFQLDASSMARNAVEDASCFVDNSLAGSEAMDEQVAPGSPFSSGASVWSHACSVESIVGSPTSSDAAIMALHKFLPSNFEDEGSRPAIDVFSSDDFRMFEFKVRRCTRGRSHDWTECPFAHPGEKARRRDPRRFHYSGTACPDFRKGSCKRGDACEYAHGVFECWLHPARYRTHPCKDGRNCKRKVCFFAHTSEQLRFLPATAASATNATPIRTGVLPPSLNSSFTQNLSLCHSYDGSPLRLMLAACDAVSVPSAEEGRGYASSQAGNGSFLSNNYLSECLGFQNQGSSAPQALAGENNHLSECLGFQNQGSSAPQALAGENNYLSECLGFQNQGSSAPQALAGENSSSIHHCRSGFILHNDTSTPPQRRHLDRLNSMPTISVPSSDSRSSASFSSPSSPTGMHDPRQMSDLASWKQLGVGDSRPAWQTAKGTNIKGARYLIGPSPLRGNSLSVPSTPTKFGKNGENHWRFDDEDIEPHVERVESGRDLRAKIFENLMARNQQEADYPDLGWVTDLVTEEEGKGKH